jgi:hypothetical protein
MIIVSYAYPYMQLMSQAKIWYKSIRKKSNTQIGKWATDRNPSQERKCC